MDATTGERGGEEDDYTLILGGMGIRVTCLVVGRKRKNGK